MPDRLVIVVPYAEEQATRNRIAELATAEWEQSIYLVGGPVRREPGDFARAESRRILKIAEDFDATSLIVTKEICCDSRLIQARSDLDVRRPATGLLRNRIVRHELEAMELDWRGILRHRLAFWGSGRADIDDWLRQFEVLGARWVGESLLRQFDVISPNEVVRAFQMPAQAMVGQRLIFTFLADDDPASSSKRIAALLAQMYDRPNVKEFVAALTDAEPGSRLIVCEDALWTGIELRNLLTRLSPGGDLEYASKGKRVTFRHCAVSDFGLHIVHQFISCNKLDSIDLFLGEGQRFIRVLAAEISDSEIRSRWEMPPAEFEDWLTTHVSPLVFQNGRLWGQRREQAIILCSAIGRQLIDRYSMD